MFESLRRLHTDLQTRALRYWRAREVVKTLQITHANELAQTPVNMWPMKKAAQAQEIAAVKSGQFNIVDRRSWAFPYIPEALHRLNQPILKNTPYNLRRFSETPVPRRALNIVKNALLSLKWRVSVADEFDEDDPELLKKVKIAEYCLEHPNLSDSWRTLMEAVVEDFLIGGYGTIEPQLTPDYRRPIKLWAVDGSTIRIYADWSEATQDRPHYAQLTGLKGERGIVAFLDDELIYIRDNVRSSTPFGLGRLEVAFLTVNAFLGAQDMSARAGSDQIHKTWLWWTQNVPPGHLETVKRHIQNDAEGQAKISLMAGLPKPDTLEVIPVTPEDLLLDWQKFLIDIMAAAFELSPMALGMERQTNRSTATVMAEADFNSAIVPAAKKFEEAITRLVIHRALGWGELKFEFVGLEDPDEMIQVMLVKQLYSCNAITPDEMRDRMQIGPPLPGGWGKLTFGQMALLTAAAVGKAGMGGGASAMGEAGGSGAMGGGVGGGGSAGMGGGSSMGMGMRMSADRPIHGSVDSLYASPFNAQDVANMDPQSAEAFRQFGLLPWDASQTQTDMESQQPGILQTLSEELTEYFQWLTEQQEEGEPDPAPVTAKDQKMQQQKYNQRQHDLTKEERNARGIEQTNYAYQRGGYRGPVPKRKILPGKKKKWDPHYTGQTGDRG